tara:strand:- start:484 stop:825 length:342 start_codon:yes stop_codon:yes gene_type:complete
MDDYTIKILNEDLIETEQSIYKIELSYNTWAVNITPWEHRRIFRMFKIPYQIGNRCAPEKYDIEINYNSIYEKMNEMKKLRKNYKYLLFAKLCDTIDHEICDDIKLKIISNIK